KRRGDADCASLSQAAVHCPARIGKDLMPRRTVETEPRKLSVPVKTAIIAGSFTLAAAIVAAVSPALVKVFYRHNENPAPSVQIIRLLPHPLDDERNNEEITIRNLTTQPISLRGWKLRDLAGRCWELEGALDPAGSPGDEKAVKRGGQAMGLNN